MYLELESRTRGLVSGLGSALGLGSAPGTGFPDPELRCKPKSGSSTLEKLINVFHIDNNIYTKAI